MRRSKSQLKASRRNGQKSRGPLSEAGKQKSSRNSKKHGLTGRIEPEVQEAAELAALYERLSLDFPDAIPGKEMLFGIILDAQLRMLRAYHLLDVYAARMLKGVDDGEVNLGHANPTLIAIREMERVFGQGNDKKLSLTDQLLSKSFLLTFERGRLSSKLIRLTHYAQRFRGQRDRALKRLARLAAEQKRMTYAEN